MKSHPTHNRVMQMMLVTRFEKLVKTPERISISFWRVGEVQAFHEDLNGRQHINEVYKFSVDKLYDILFSESQFMSDFMEQRRISGQLTSDHAAVKAVCSPAGFVNSFCFAV